MLDTGAMAQEEAVERQAHHEKVEAVVDDRPGVGVAHGTQVVGAPVVLCKLSCFICYSLFVLFHDTIFESFWVCRSILLSNSEHATTKDCEWLID